MNKLLKALLTTGMVGTVASFGEIKVTDNFSTSGFFDMSAGAVITSDEETIYGGFDQLELDFMYDFKNGVTARADINTNGGVIVGDPADPETVGNDLGITMEQAFITATPMGGPLSITAGKFLSSTGWEAAEPVDMFQYSYSKTLVYGGYQNGIALNFSQPMFNIYLAAIGSVWDGGNTDFEKPAFEAQLALMPVEALTAKIAYAMDTETTSGVENQGLLNAWVSYAVGPALLAGEFNYMTNWEAEDVNGMGWLVMANVGIGDKAGVTVRYSGIQIDEGDPDQEITVSPSYVFNDNLSGLVELKYEIDAEVTNIAVETIFAF